MAQIIGLPKLSPTREEGVLVRWTKKEGDKVSPGDLVAEVETDKANMDFNIEDEGVLLKLLVKEGETVKLGAPVAIIGKAGEDVASLVAEAGKQAAAPAPAPAAKPEGDGKAKPTTGDGKAAAPTTAPRDRRAPTTKPPAPAGKPQPPPAPKPPPAVAAPAKLLASPLAKTLAIELGVDLRTITGTGPGGRIVERDVRDAAQGATNGHAQEAEAEV